MGQDDTTMLDVDDGAETLGVTPLQLSDDEQRILDLYDRLRDLQLQTALLRAQHRYVPDTSAAVGADEDVTKAQAEVLETRARYMLRNDVVDSVMTANPILKAVHGAKTASPIELDLLPNIMERDAHSISLATQSSELRQTLDQLIAVEAESLRVSQKNMALAAEVIRLAEETNQTKLVQTDDPEAREQLEQLDVELKASRQRWKVMKGTASGVVAGSGLGWARDPDLRYIVLDPEDEDT